MTLRQQRQKEALDIFEREFAEAKKKIERAGELREAMIKRPDYHDRGRRSAETEALIDQWMEAYEAERDCGRDLAIFKAVLDGAPRARVAAIVGLRDVKHVVDRMIVEDWWKQRQRKVQEDRARTSGDEPCCVLGCAG